MDYLAIKDLLQKDVISAGYGVVTATIRKGASKVLGNQGVGSMGMNALSIAVGMGLSQIENPHVKIIGSALRISGIASIGNSIVERIVNRNKTIEDK